MIAGHDKQIIVIQRLNHGALSRTFNAEQNKSMGKVVEGRVIH